MVGETLLAVDNIGSIVILRGEPSYGALIFGAILLIVGVFMLQSNLLMALLVIGAGVGLITWNLNQKVDKGLSIGTCDGRTTLIVSTDEDFLLHMLEFIRLKVDTGAVSLRGRFDITNNHFQSEGGGIVVGDQGIAGGAGGRIDAT